MLAKVKSFSLFGLTGLPIEVETDINNGLPAYDLVGLPDTAVKESKERVRSAIKNSGRKFPLTKLTINLAPADMKKEGSHFDLAIALCILKASEQLVNVDLSEYVLLGELALDGAVRQVNGLLPLLIAAKSNGLSKFIVPWANANEASFVEGLRVYPVKTLKEAIDHLSGLNEITPLSTKSYEAVKGKFSGGYDIAYVKGQAVAKRAIEVAVSGGHNVLLVGPPGTGKTMLARSIPSIMPDMSFDEALEVTKIHSIAGILSEEGIVTVRPFRTPHHTATTVSMCGGGNKSIRPGEISLAHNGVLFLDEMPEYTRGCLESLRQPLEDGCITVSRASGAVTYPANFVMCASMNPCPCGNYGSKTLPCKCSANEIRKYRGKISGPLLDRIDIQVEVDSVEYDDLISDKKEESSAAVKERVDFARQIQHNRFASCSIHTNADMHETELKRFCALSAECENILKLSFERLKLSARARSRIIKVARTIADLGASDEILPEHLLEAVSYRTFDLNNG